MHYIYLYKISVYYAYLQYICTNKNTIGVDIYHFGIWKKKVSLDIFENPASRPRVYNKRVFIEILTKFFSKFRSRLSPVFSITEIAKKLAGVTLFLCYVLDYFTKTINVCQKSIIHPYLTISYMYEIAHDVFFHNFIF